MKKNILYYILFASVLIMAAAGEEINPSSPYDDIMDLDEDFGEVEDLEEIDLEASPDENVRYLRVSSSSGQQLKVPRKPNLRNMPRGRAPKGWDKAKRSGRQYKGFDLHTWCSCALGGWFCFCWD